MTHDEKMASHPPDLEEPTEKIDELQQKIQELTSQIAEQTSSGPKEQNQ